MPLILQNSGETALPDSRKSSQQPQPAKHRLFNKTLYCSKHITAINKYITYSISSGNTVLVTDDYSFPDKKTTIVSIPENWRKDPL